MSETVECLRCRESDYDRETKSISLLSVMGGVSVGVYLVGACGFYCGYMNLAVLGGTLMGCGFGLLVWALRMKGKRLVMKNGAGR